MDIGAQSPEIISALLTKRQILLQSEIDSSVQVQICRFIIYLNSVDQTPITLFIDSNGGDTELSLFICDVIQHSQAEVHGIVIADANSAAFRILQACHKRLAYPHASMLFHATTIAGRRVDADDLEEYLKKLKGCHEEQVRVFAERSKQSIKQIREWSKKEKRFTAQEAKAAGFLDEVIEPPGK